MVSVVSGVAINSIYDILEPLIIHQYIPLVIYGIQHHDHLPVLVVILCIFLVIEAAPHVISYTYIDRSTTIPIHFSEKKHNINAMGVQLVLEYLRLCN